MEEPLASLLASCEEREFLRVTSTALKIIQNIQNEASEDKFRRLRRTAPVSCPAARPFVSRTLFCKKMRVIVDNLEAVKV